MRAANKGVKPNGRERIELETRATAASPIVGRLLKIGAQVPRAHWRKVPADLSVNLDHYLYGFPKQ